MADWKGNVLLFQQVQQIQKPRELKHGIRLVPVGIGEMGENALRLQARQAADLPDPGRRALQMAAVAQPA